MWTKSIHTYFTLQRINIVTNTTVIFKSILEMMRWHSIIIVTIKFSTQMTNLHLYMIKLSKSYHMFFYNDVNLYLDLVLIYDVSLIHALI